MLYEKLYGVFWKPNNNIINWPPEKKARKRHCAILLEVLKRTDENSYFRALCATRITSDPVLQ